MPRAQTLPRQATLSPPVVPTPPFPSAKQGIAYLGAAYRLLQPITEFESAMEALDRIAELATVHRQGMGAHAQWEQFRCLTESLEILAVALANKETAHQVLHLVSALPIQIYPPPLNDGASASIPYELCLNAEHFREALRRRLCLEISLLPT